MDNKIIIYKSKRKAIGITIVGVLLALAGWLFLRYAQHPVVAGSFIILSVLCLIFGLGSFFDRKPSLIFTATGITKISGGKQEIEWDAIRQVGELYYRSQHFIRLLTDRNYKPSEILPTGFYRFERLYEQAGVKAIFIKTSFLEVNSMQLLHFISNMVKANAEDREKILDNFRISLQQLRSR